MHCGSNHAPQGAFQAGGSGTGGALASAGAAVAGAAEGGTDTRGGMSSGGAPSGGAPSGGASSGGASSGGASSGGASSGSPLLVPVQGALLGAFVGSGTFTELETLLGRRLAIRHTFVGWTDDYSSVVQSDLASGYIPLITWEAWTNQVGVPLDEIVSGVHDSMIQARAASAKNAQRKFFLRWGHEMNGNWYPWDGSHNGANAAGVAKYIAAYRHVHDLFVAAGATNVLWVFCPNADSVPGDAWNAWSNYYPGDAYVDWMGIDGYNWGTAQSGSTWQAFATIAGRIYAGVAAKGKPVMIPETASAELGGDKAAWIAALLPALKGSFPQIKAFVWFHMNKETDWRVNSSTTAQQRFITFASDPYLNP